MNWGGRGAGIALAFAVLALLAPAAQAAAAPAGSKAGVTPYYLPRTPPTGGAGPIVFGPDGQVWFTEVYEEEGHYPPQIVRMNGLGQIAVVAQHQRAEDSRQGSTGVCGSPIPGTLAGSVRTTS